MASNLITNADSNRSSIELPIGTDFNSIIIGGRYNLNILNSLNAPIPTVISKWVFVDIQRHSNPAFAFTTQLVYDFYDATVVYHRVGTGGDGVGVGVTWSTWASIGGISYISENTSNKGAFNGYAPLVNGKVPQSNLPGGVRVLSLLSTASMIATLASEGDVVIITSSNKSWIRNASVRTATISDWTAISVLSSDVFSVAGKTGTVTLNPSDVGAEPSNPNIQAHIIDQSNPHNVLISQISDFQAAHLNGGYF